MSSFAGFPRGAQYTPVPNLFFGPLLEQIDDLAELKCTLRFLWLMRQRKGHPQAVSQEELLADRILLGALKDPQEVRRGLRRAVERGTLLKACVEPGKAAYLLHTPANREYVARLPPAMGDSEMAEGDAPAPPAERPNIFVLYEQNIGMLAPLIAEELMEAEAAYPWEWIQEAFKEAVRRNRRSWKYIARILERWATEGKDHGEPGRYPEKITAWDLIRRYRLPRG